jgi:hypothetical protein
MSAAESSIANTVKFVDDSTTACRTSTLNQQNADIVSGGTIIIKDLDWTQYQEVSEQCMIDAVDADATQKALEEETQQQAEDIAADPKQNPNGASSSNIYEELIKLNTTVVNVYTGTCIAKATASQSLYVRSNRNVSIIGVNWNQTQQTALKCVMKNSVVIGDSEAVNKVTGVADAKKSDWDTWGMWVVIGVACFLALLIVILVAVYVPRRRKAKADAKARRLK